jgi:hypothetical protein
VGKHTPYFHTLDFNTHFQPLVDQHLAYGCYGGKGHRNRAHLSLQNIVNDAAKNARLSCIKAKDVTLAQNADPQNKKFMDLAILDSDNNTTYWVDVTHVSSLSTTAQKHSVAYTQAFDTRISDKTKYYGLEAEDRNALLVPFVVDSHGSFAPRTDPISHPTNDQATEVRKRLFGDDGIPKRGGIKLSFEEGFLRKLARRAASEDGMQFFDRTLPEHVSSGMFLNQLYMRIAHSSLKGSALSTLSAIRRQTSH